MQIYNSLTRTKQELIPNEPGKIKMYTCGPTVYHFAHIGNHPGKGFWHSHQRIF